MHGPPSPAFRAMVMSSQGRASSEEFQDQRPPKPPNLNFTTVCTLFLADFEINHLTSNRNDGNSKGS